MNVTIRAATIEDAPALGEVHVKAWQRAYRGMMPDDYLDSLSAANRADMWRQWIEAAPHGVFRDVIEADGQLVGFAAYGPERGTVDEPGVGELAAINIDPDHWRHGLGRQLLSHVTDELTRLGYRRAVLWVVKENERARRFYEAEGWASDGTERVDNVQGATVNEVRYTRTLGS